MKTEYTDTAFGNLIFSYHLHCDGLSDDEIEQALRAHAKKWSGCIACRYSLCHHDAGKRGNIWHQRSCQVGLSQDGCGMFQNFPE